MSHTPERYFCDFCTNELQRTDKRVTIEVPLTTAERRAIAAEWEKGGQAPPTGIFGAMLPILQMVSRSYTVVSCLPCINTILPDAIALRKTKIAEALAEMQTARARRQQAEDDEVEADR